MIMVLCLLLQKPLNHGLIVKVLDRLPMLPYHPQAAGIFELWKFSLHSVFSLAVLYQAPSERLNTLLQVSCEYCSVLSLARHQSLLIGVDINSETIDD